jgi:hypothetical protein
VHFIGPEGGGEAAGDGHLMKALVTSWKENGEGELNEQRGDSLAVRCARGDATARGAAA